MCSVGDDIDESGEAKFMTAKEKVNLLESKCNKCREQTPSVLLRGKDVYCKQCFINGTTHKFKSLLGKHKLIHPNDNVLIHHDVGHASAALLHMLRSGLDLNTPKKLRFKPVFLFIDRFASLGANELKEGILKQLEHYNFTVYFISFSAYLKQRDRVSELLTLDPKKCEVNESDLDVIRDKIGFKASETNRNEIFNVLQNDLLTAVAKELDCKFVFTPQLSADIASQILTNVSLGRGLHIPFDTGFCDSRNSDVKILRPLRVFEEKELAFYNAYNNVETVNITFAESDPFASIQNLMKKFVNELQINYPATIATIVRTGDKLAVHEDSELNRKCKLCKALVERPSNEFTAKRATEISRQISRQRDDVIGSKLLNGFHGAESEQYCYSCSKIAEFIKV